MLKHAQAALSFFRSVPCACLSDYFCATCQNVMLPYTHLSFWISDKVTVPAFYSVKARLSDSAPYMMPLLNNRFGACSYLGVAAGSEEAARLIQAQGVTQRMHSLVASTDTPAAAAGGGTAALLQTTALLDYAGFAMTAKPSVNLLVLLQVCLQLVTLCLPIWRGTACVCKPCAEFCFVSFALCGQVVTHSLCSGCSFIAADIPDHGYHCLIAARSVLYVWLCLIHCMRYETQHKGEV
jgi:hypothetical protein